VENELQEFFSGLADRMEIAASYEKRIARFEAPRFNLFNSTYIGSLENKITEVLRDLLDPAGSHGQGPIFLERFLKRVGFGRALASEATKARVRTQHLTKKGRSIDLTIRMGTYILGLENKIDAREQNLQLADYIEEIRSDSQSDYFFVFLTPDLGRDPKSCDREDWNRLKREKRARSLSYGELGGWLHSWTYLCGSNRVRVLLEDMAVWAKNLRRDRVKNSFTATEVANFVVQHKEHVKASLAVCDASSVLKKALVQDFAGALEEHILRKLNERVPLQEWLLEAAISRTDPDDREPKILFRNSAWPHDCLIGIEAETIYKRFYFGIKWKDAPSDIRAKLKSPLKQTDYWPWSQFIDDFQGIHVERGWYDPDTLEGMHGEKGADIIEYLGSLVIKAADVAQALFDRKG
jgi:hypothetical protein